MNPMMMIGMALLFPQEQPPDRPPVQVLAVPQVVAPNRGEVIIRVDGALLEWPDLLPLNLDHPLQLSGTPAYGTSSRAWKGPEDLSGKGFLIWDEEYLYFACVVRDDWARPLQENHPVLDEVPPVDSIVLSFDINRNTRTIGADEGRRAGHCRSCRWRYVPSRADRSARYLYPQPYGQHNHARLRL